MAKWRITWILVLVSPFLVLIGMYRHTTRVLNDHKISGPSPRHELPQGVEWAITLDRLLPLMPFGMLTAFTAAAVIGFKAFRHKWLVASLQSYFFPAFVLGWTFWHAGMMRAKEAHWRELHLRLTDAQIASLGRADFLLKHWVIVTVCVMLASIVIGSAFGFVILRKRRIVT